MESSPSSALQLRYTIASRGIIIALIWIIIGGIGGIAGIAQPSQSRSNAVTTQALTQRLLTAIAN